MPKNAVHEITDQIPAGLICQRLGVKERSIRAARENGLFPASWFKEMNALCGERGIECPIGVFNWKSSSADAPSAEAVK